MSDSLPDIRQLKRSAIRGSVRALYSLNQIANDSEDNKELFLEILPISFYHIGRTLPPSPSASNTEILQICLFLDPCFTTPQGAIYSSKDFPDRIPQLELQIRNNWPHILRWTQYLVEHDRPETVKIASGIGGLFNTMHAVLKEFSQEMMSNSTFVHFLGKIWNSFSINRWRALYNSDGRMSLPEFIFRITSGVMQDRSTDLAHQFLATLGDNPSEIASNALRKLDSVLYSDYCISYLRMAFKIFLLPLRGKDPVEVALVEQGAVSVISQTLYRLTSERKKPVKMDEIPDAPLQTPIPGLIRDILDMGASYLALVVSNRRQYTATFLEEKTVRCILKSGPYMDRGLAEAYIRLLTYLILPALIFPIPCSLVIRCLNSIDYESRIKELKEKDKALGKSLDLLLRTITLREEARHAAVAHCGRNMCERSVHKVYRCSGCQAVSYCSHRCQKQMWNAHKYICIGMLTLGEPPEHRIEFQAYSWLYFNLLDDLKNDKHCPSVISTLSRTHTRSTGFYLPMILFTYESYPPKIMMEFDSSNGLVESGVERCVLQIEVPWGHNSSKFLRFFCFTDVSEVLKKLGSQ